MILPCWNKALPANVNIKKIVMGIHPLIRVFRGILKRSIGIAAKMIKYTVMSFMKNRKITKSTYVMILISGDNRLPVMLIVQVRRLFK